MEKTYDCPICNADIETSEFLPAYVECPICHKKWVLDFETDGDSYFTWLTGDEFVE